MTKQEGRIFFTLLVTIIFFTFPSDTQATLFFWSVFREHSQGNFYLQGYVALQADLPNDSSSTVISRYFIPHFGAPLRKTSHELFSNCTRSNLKQATPPPTGKFATARKFIKNLFKSEERTKSPQQCQQKFSSIFDWNKPEELTLNILNNQYNPVIMTAAKNDIDFYHFRDIHGADHYEPFSGQNFLSTLIGLVKISQSNNEDILLRYAAQISNSGITGNDPAFGIWCQNNITLLQTANTMLPGFIFSQTGNEPLETVMHPIPASVFDGQLLLTLSNGSSLQQLHSQQVSTEQFCSSDQTFPGSELTDTPPSTPEEAILEKYSTNEVNPIDEETPSSHGNIEELTEDELIKIALKTKDPDTMMRANSILIQRENDVSSYTNTELQEIFLNPNESLKRQRAAKEELEQRLHRKLTLELIRKMNNFSDRDRRVPGGGGAAEHYETMD